MAIWLSIAGGLIALLVGGEMLVRGAVASARSFGVSPLLIGLTLVGFGTSTPELLTSVQAALVGSLGIAVGNVVGSNTANILLILGCSAVIYPLAVSPQALRRDGLVVFLAACVCVVVTLIGEIGWLTGAVLVALLLVYVGYTYLRERVSHDASAAMHEAEAASVAPEQMPWWRALPIALAGLLVTLLGAWLLVDGAIEAASAAGVSETLLGLTIVAVGTSLPELVTSVMAAIHRHSDVAIGNILGSNIFNVLGILGVTAMVERITVPDEIARFDVWVMLAATLVMLLFAATGRRLSRAEGMVLVAGYVVYVGYLISVA